MPHREVFVGQNPDPGEPCTKVYGVCQQSVGCCVKVYRVNGYGREGGEVAPPREHNSITETSRERLIRTLNSLVLQGEGLILGTGPGGLAFIERERRV